MTNGLINALIFYGMKDILNIRKATFANPGKPWNLAICTIVPDSYFPTVQKATLRLCSLFKLLISTS